MTADKNPKYWARYARRYDRATLLINRRFPQMARHVAGALTGRGDVLELAAGTGMVTVEIASVVRSLVATDMSPEMLAVLGKRIEALGMTNVIVKEADVSALTFADQSFDAVVIANVLHLLSDPKRALGEARRVLRDGGLLCAPTFCHGESIAAQIASRIFGLTGFPIVTRFNSNTLRALVAGCGFDIQSQAKFDGILPMSCVVAVRS